MQHKDVVRKMDDWKVINLMSKEMKKIAVDVVLNRFQFTHTAATTIHNPLAADAT